MNKRKSDLRSNADLITVIQSSSVEDFFERGKRIAQEADSAKPIRPERIISFEDPVEFLDYLELEAIRKHSQLTEESAATLAEEIDREVWSNIKPKFSG